MNKEICLVCSATSGSMIDILNTNLQTMYEKLTDLKVHNEIHHVCIICSRRLQQCYQLQQFSIKQNTKQNAYKSRNTIITSSSISKLLNVTIPWKSEEFVDKMEVTVKQEVVDDDDGGVLDIEVKQEKLDYFEPEIKIEIDTSECLSVEPININYTEISEDTQVQHSKVTNVEMDKLDTKNILANVSQYFCDICPYKTTDKRTLYKHRYTHTKCIEHNLHKCKFCLYGTKTKLLPNEKKSKSYKCDVCKKAFSSKHMLMLHGRTHTGDKPYECNVCSKTFSVRSNLLTHKRVHTGEKPCVCDVCNKRFSRSSSLKRHKRMHTGDKPYVCDVCNKTFSTSSNLLTHKRTHTGDKPYICDICHKTFPRSNCLIRHKRTHMEDSPCVCDICKKTFRGSDSLIRHKKIHTIVRPYACDLCYKSFSLSKSFIRHKQTHK